LASFADASPIATTIHKSARVSVITRPALVDGQNLAVRRDGIANTCAAISVKAMAVRGVGNAVAVDLDEHVIAGEGRRWGVGRTSLGIIDKY